MHTGNIFASLRLAAGALGLIYGTRQCSRESRCHRQSMQHSAAAGNASSIDHTSHTSMWVGLALLTAGAMYLLSRKPHERFIHQ